MKVIEKLIVIGIISMTLLGIYTLTVIKEKGSKCLANPIEFGVKEYSTFVRSNLSCNCFFQNEKIIPFLVDINGTHLLRKEVVEPIYPSFVNLSLS